jgi:hypothetical protein
MCFGNCSACIMATLLSGKKLRELSSDMHCESSQADRPALRTEGLLPAAQVGAGAETVVQMSASYSETGLPKPSSLSSSSSS